MLNIVLFGPPGAGKGTQSDKIVKEYNLIHLSTGEMLRDEIAQATELGKQAKELIDEGKLVPDKVVVEMIKHLINLHSEANGFIFDGFPRTMAQANALDHLLTSEKTSISGMISLKVPKKELISRILLRGKTSGRSDDNNEEIIEQRIKEYNAKTAPLEGYYKKQDKYFPVDGVGKIDEIFERISKVINRLQD